MNSLHLFAGIGGGILADKILGHRIVGAVEIDSYCRDVLKQRQEEGFLEPFPIFEDVRTFDGTELKEPVDLVCGGFPCQDISIAGKGEGIEGSQSSLFYELIRICGIIRPEYIFLENSPIIVSRGLDKVLEEIAILGYNAEWSSLSAGTVGASHKRNRWWCLCKKQEQSRDENLLPQTVSAKIFKRFMELDDGTWVYSSRRKENPLPREKRFLPHANGVGRTRKVDGSTAKTGQSEPVLAGRTCREVEKECGWWQDEPRVRRVVNELPNRMDRTKALGNAQVPVCAAVAFYLLMKRYEE